MEADHISTGGCGAKGATGMMQVEPATAENLSMEELMKIPSTCPNCQQSADTNICQVDIPHFKQIILMTLLCECGYRSTEVKPAGGISKHGTKTTLRVQNEEDLKREVILSDTAAISVPNIELELEEGMEQGVYTTVEGLIKRLLSQLTLANPFAIVDTKPLHSDNEATMHAKYRKFLTRLGDIGGGKSFPATLIVNDPLSNSYIGPVPRDAIAVSDKADKEQYTDDGLAIEGYERTVQQNEALGLNQMKTEDYSKISSCNS